MFDLLVLFQVLDQIATQIALFGLQLEVEMSDVCRQVAFRQESLRAA
jgi:hypothetical protein